MFGPSLLLYHSWHVTVRQFGAEQKFLSKTQLSITLLLIIIVDGVLRIIRLVLVVMADYYGFSDSSLYHVIFLVAIRAEYVNHPVVCGLILCEVYQKLLYTNKNVMPANIS